ncbi:phospholipase D-like domain-containing protein [Nonomuraea sp. NPDC050790]|uniref:phospholipase D-like domain-containing protein n=1 Tax=Nonomuraea sp. NPDC050790 TaxID=3364371 RepID=UPI0037BB95A4
MINVLPGLVLLLGLAVPAETAASSHLTAHFTAPSITGVTDSSLETRLTELIDLAAPGSTLRLATFVLERAVIKDKLVQAAQRDVDVRVVAEKTGHHPLLDQLATDLGPGHVVLCADACNTAGRDVMHHKFAVFSRLSDGRTDVVAQSSQNLDAKFGAHQNMLVSSGDAGLAAGYRGVFDKLWSQQVYTWSAPFTSSSGKITAWMMPRADDPVVAELNAVTCPGSIRLAQSQFSVERDEVLKSLVNRRNAGCSVQVFVPDGNQTTAAARELAKAGIVVHTFRPGGCHEPVGTCGVATIHSKIMLVDDARGKKYVYTGSHNINQGSLARADDSFLRIDDPAIYTAYAANLDLLYEQAIKLVPAAYPDAALRMAANGPADQRTPRASAERNGYTALAWEGGGQVTARIYRHGLPVTAPIRVDMGGVGCATGWEHIQPSAGVDDAGNAYVAWAENGDCRTEHNIAVRKISATGQLGATTWVNQPEWRGDQTRPRIAVTGAGAYTVVWEDGETATVRAAGHSSSGTRLWGPAEVSPGNRPDVAVDASGVATVVWQQAPSVYGTRLGTTGAVVAGRTRINVNAAGQHLAPAVATTATGDSVVAWSDNLDNIWRVRTRGFTPSLAGRFAEMPVKNGRYTLGQEADGNLEYPPLCDLSRCAVQGSPSIAVDPAGRFVVGWTESDLWNDDRSHEVYAKGFNPNGSTTGRFPAERMNPNTVGNQFATAVSAGPGGFTYFYTEDFDINGYADIVARTGFTNTAF